MQFKKLKFRKTNSGPTYDPRKRIFYNDFWHKVTKIFKIFEQIIKVLKLVDDDKKHTMRFIYETVDKPKHSIQQNYYHLQYNMIDKDKNFYILICILHVNVFI